MTKKGGEKVRYLYGVCFSLLTVTVGILFIWQVWSIYRSAPQRPFAGGSISMHFKQIAIPVWLWVAALVGSILLALIYPEKEGRPKAYVNLEIAMARTKKRLPTDGEYLEQIQKVERECSKARKIIGWIACGGIAVALAVALYILMGKVYLPILQAEFFADHNGMVDRLVQCAVLAVIALTGGSIAAELWERNLKREQKAYLDILVEAKKAGKAPTVAEKGEKAAKEEGKSEKRIKIVRISLAVVAVAFLVFGIYNGGMKDVLLKAINICTQCIGLG